MRLPSFAARLGLAVVLLPFALPAAPGEPRALAPEPVYTDIARRFAQMLPAQHLTCTNVDDQLSARAWTNYLRALDFDRSYFLQEDIEAFAQDRERLDDQLQAGDIAFAYRVFNCYRDRVRDRVRHVETALGTAFDLKADESYAWQRKDAAWPADRGAWDELWRQRLKNQYLQLQIGREERDAKAARLAAATNAAPAAATNAPAGPATNTVATGGATETQDIPTPADAAGAPLDEESSSAEDLNQPPEQAIVKRYREVQTVIEDVDAEWVLQRYLNAFAMACDPHSAYMTPTAVADFDIEMNLEVHGIGALLRSEDGAAQIERLIPGGPAERDGRLKEGDRIIAVAEGKDGSPVSILHWPLYRSVKLIRGKKGSWVVLTVIPASDPSGSATRRIAIQRDEVKLEEQAAKWRLREAPDAGGRRRKIGILRLPTFYANMQVHSKLNASYRSCADDVAGILRTVNTAGVDGLVLDLRSNGGGALMEANRLTGLFIPGGPIVQVKELGARPMVLRDPDPSMQYGGPLVVLLNRLSASASEILAAALQDYGRAIIVGDARTHGKGSVQTLLELGPQKELGKLKITTAIYYRVSGLSVQLDGVRPDIEIPSPFASGEYGEQYLPFPLQWTPIEPAVYMAGSDLSTAAGELRRQSEERRAHDPAFASYLQLLERLRRMNETDSVPLQLDRRRAMAREERELAEIQDKLVKEQTEGVANGTPEEKDDAHDVVLRETLRVAADLAAIYDAQPQLRPQMPAFAPRSLADWMSEWMRTLPER